jgi:hypothetical protein
MSPITEQEAIERYLRSHRTDSDETNGFVEVKTITEDTGISAVRVAFICSQLVMPGILDAAGGMMGFYRLSDSRVAYHDAVNEMNAR